MFNGHDVLPLTEMWEMRQQQYIYADAVCCGSKWSIAHSAARSQKDEGHAMQETNMIKHV